MAPDPVQGTRPLHEVVAEVMGATRAKRKERIQSLWGGYGEVARYRLDGAQVESVVVKHVHAPAGSGVGHRRKLRSYQVERNWYGRFAPRSLARLPHAFHLAEGLFVLEDLDAAGFPGRGRRLPTQTVLQCVHWLADFHRSFLGEAPEGLWPVGTYWHLATRPDEHRGMACGPLRDAALALDEALSSPSRQTFVHGDAKAANFCLGQGAAAVDFQYVGGGIGLKDLAYFLGSCLGESELQAQADGLLGQYFDRLDDAAAESQWRPLWPHAWADFERFMAGWSPGHSKSTGFAARKTRQALAQVAHTGPFLGSGRNP